MLISYYILQLRPYLLNAYRVFICILKGQLNALDALWVVSLKHIDSWHSVQGRQIKYPSWRRYKNCFEIVKHKVMSFKYILQNRNPDTLLWFLIVIFFSRIFQRFVLISDITRPPLAHPRNMAYVWRPAAFKVYSLCLIP